jgi:hypothetical protein
MMNYGLRWGVTFLQTDSRIPMTVKYHLIDQATQMYLSDEDQRRISAEGIEGQITTGREYQNIAGCGGQKFQAEVDSEWGSSKLEFLVCEKTNGLQDVDCNN